MPDTSALVDLRNVTFSYGERVILRDVSLQVPRGKVTALMGASGGGKTTVLRLIGGQQRAQQGQVLFDGQDVGLLDAAGLFAARRRMGMLFQFGALFTDLSVFENVAFPLREHTDLPEELVRDIVLMKLGAVGLRGARDLMPSQISGGMAWRVALERAPGGRYVVRLTGGRPVTEPFIDLLLEASWNSGRIVRDYTVLLDPPGHSQRMAALCGQSCGHLSGGLSVTVQQRHLGTDS